MKSYWSIPSKINKKKRKNSTIFTWSLRNTSLYERYLCDPQVLCVRYIHHTGLPRQLYHSYPEYFYLFTCSQCPIHVNRGRVADTGHGDRHEQTFWTLTVGSSQRVQKCQTKMTRLKDLFCFISKKLANDLAPYYTLVS